MNSIRESEWLNWEVFNVDEVSDVFVRFSWRAGHLAMWAVVVLNCFLVGGLSSVFIGNWFILAWAVAPLLLAYASSRLGRLHVLHGIERSGLSIYEPWNEFEYLPPWNLRKRASEYLALSKEDRKEYPKDILKVLRDPDLTEDQCRALDYKMRSLYTSIIDRNEQRMALEPKRRVEIDGLLAQMEDNAYGIDEETSVYREG